MRKTLANGAGGFIVSYWVRRVDLKLPEFSVSSASEFLARDLRDPNVALAAVEGFEDVY